jgi:RimJ/RimL family protein N-acetyltransferase
MPSIPTLTTPHLVLRPFNLDDAPAVTELAGDYAIADTTLAIPHPYEEWMAVEWISKHQPTFESGEGITLAITRRPELILVGAISLFHIVPEYRLAEMGYWVGKPYWNLGYCTEAAREIIRYGFEELNLNRIQAQHLTRNPASGRVMQKAGMKFEGVLRQCVCRRGVFEDLAMYSILRQELAEGR